MKVKNLLLAGLAVAAMTACSNNDEIVDNGIKNDGTAFMQLSFEFPSSRATTVENETDDKGTDSEYNVQTVDVRLVYTDGSIKNYAKSIDEFNVENSGQSLVLKAVETVPAGTIREASAVLNKGILDLTGANWATTKVSSTETGLGYLAVTNGIAAANNFLMSGKITESIEFVKGGTENVVIPVSRVSAKLDEATAKKTHIIAANKDENAQISEEMEISLTHYSYGNLTKTSYLLADNSSSVIDEQTYFHKYASNNYEYKDINAEDVVYCMENAATDGLQNNSTFVLYKATVAFGGVAPIAPFYVYNNKVYKTLSELKAGNAAIGEAYNDETSQAEYLKMHIYKYEDGLCYYMTEVDDSTDEHKVVRNTWYKLDVESIAKLGYPTPEVPPTFDKDAYMNLKITINPWKVRFNKIHF